MTERLLVLTWVLLALFAHRTKLLYFKRTDLSLSRLALALESLNTRAEQASLIKTDGGSSAHTIATKRVEEACLLKLVSQSELLIHVNI